MATDMDIEMDLDLGFTAEEMAVQDVEIIPDVELSSDFRKALPSGPNDTTEANSHEPSPHKVHIRGVDNLTTNDIRGFALKYFEAHRPIQVEWIDDTSANLVYDTAEIARQALIAFAGIEIADVSQIPILQTVPAKAFPLHPHANLEIRLAVTGDRKQRGARERSRFYLMNPEHDPAERRKRGGDRNGNRYRDRDDGGYRSQRYDDREQRERQDRDADAGFDAGMYDDDAPALAKRASRHRRHDSSSDGSRGRDSRRVRFGGSGGKELFPERGVENGRLRDRSASPMRDDHERDEARLARVRKQDATATANRKKAQLIKARLLEASATKAPKELFPQKSVHRRSDAFDAADETADLFSSRMSVPFMDGSSDPHSANGSLASRVTTRHSDSNDIGYTIRGSAKSPPAQNFSIKGAASVRELFPASLGGNSGKELFSDRLEGRGRRRQKAEDLFY